MGYFGIPIRNGLPIGLGSLVGFGIRSFDPSELFAAGEQGTWYDPSDFSTLFQDSAGTTPVTGVEQVVGLMLDKSKGLVLGPELVNLASLPTPSIQDNSGSIGTWTAATRTISNTTTGTNASYPRFRFDFGLVTNTIYQVRGKLTGNTAFVNQIRLAISGVANSIAYNSSTGEFFAAFRAASGSILEINTDGTLTAPQSVAISELSIRQVLGNHATATGSARPTLSARVNRLLSTETLATQNVTTVAATYTLYFTGTGSITLSGTATGTYSAGSNTVTCTAGTLTLTVSGTVTTADLRVTNDGVGIPAYQRVNTSTDYDTAGFPVYLAFGGAQAMSTPANVDFSGTDKMTVFAGARKLSDAALGFVTELSNSLSANNGVFWLINGDGSLGAGPIWQFASKGTINRFATSPGNYASPITNVLSGIGDIGASALTLRVNGAQVATETNSQGTGNYGSYPLYIGARNLASLFFTGRLYSLITRGAATDSASVAATEAWVNQRTAAY